MQQIQPWDRQPGESGPAFEARKTYVFMGAARSLERVGQELAKSRALLSRWSIRWKWVQTATAYDIYVGEQASKTTTDRLIAEAVAQAERLKARQRELPECLYSIFIDSYNDLVEHCKDVKAGKMKQNHKAKQTLIKSIEMLTPGAKWALEMMAEAQAVSGNLASEPSKSSDKPETVPGRTLAVLKAFVDYK